MEFMEIWYSPQLDPIFRIQTCKRIQPNITFERTLVKLSFPKLFLVFLVYAFSFKRSVCFERWFFDADWVGTSTLIKMNVIAKAFKHTAQTWINAK